MIRGPFLLYIGRAGAAEDIKTSRGVAVFRPQDCVGEFRHDGCSQTLGLPRLTLAEAKAQGAETLILGVTNPGGVMDETIIADALAAIDAGLNIASGLHQRLRQQPRLVEAASRAGVLLHDVRDPPEGLRVGNARRRAGNRLLTVGTDCAVGKMYTALLLTEGLRKRGTAADFRATGQTGILVAGEGVPLDAVVADFISGAIEQLSPARGDGGWDVIEGQGSLFHASFAGVSLGLLHGAQPDALVLCHQPGRPNMRGLPHYALPPLKLCLEANLQAARLTNPEVRAVGVALNTSQFSPEEAERLCRDTSQELGIPCVDPVRMGVDPIVDRMMLCGEPSPRGAKHFG